MLHRGDRADSGGQFGCGLGVPRRHQLCLYAINSPAGNNPAFHCQTVDVPDVAPFGNVDYLAGGAGEIGVSGWALDLNTAAPIQVHAYVDGGGRAFVANGARPDVGRAFGLGDAHGFAFQIPAPPGPHTVCVYAINVPRGDNPPLRCSRVTVTS